MGRTDPLTSSAVICILRAGVIPMDQVRQLGETLQRISELKDQLADLERLARELIADVGAELGVTVSETVEKHRPKQAPGKRKPGPRPKRGGQVTDYERCVQAVTVLARPSRLQDVAAYLEQAGTLIPRNSLRTYMIRAARKGDLQRVQDQPGAYEAPKAARP